MKWLIIIWKDGCGEKESRLSLFDEMMYSYFLCDVLRKTDSIELVPERCGASKRTIQKIGWEEIRINTSPVCLYIWWMEQWSINILFYSTRTWMNVGKKLRWVGPVICFLFHSIFLCMSSNIRSFATKRNADSRIFRMHTSATCIFD